MELETFARHFGDSTDLDYLRLHFARFVATQELAKKRWSWKNACILDIGAHWLHQSVLYAIEDHQVIAADFPIPLASAEAGKIASEHGIEMLIYDDLANELVFDSIPESSVDVVLFCEILEHITFNPVGMWRAIYRVLRPGGRIILTTPNVYCFSRLVRNFIRFCAGRGSGISVEDILKVPTHSPHWKEYSKKEIRSYFEMLSSDFSLGSLKYFAYPSGTGRVNWKGWLAHDIPGLVPMFREGIYVEIDLPGKESGVISEPHWQ